MVKVAITGGIGSGKSTVRQLMSEMGAIGLDADEISRRVVEPGSEGAGRVMEAFGPEFFHGEGRLDRQKMARFIFADGKARARLEKILHPLILEEESRAMEEAAAGHTDPILAVEIPLLAEGRRHDLYDIIVVVTAPEDLRLERLVRSGKYTRDEALARMGHQVKDEVRLKVADYVVDNGGPVEQTRECLAGIMHDIRERLVPGDS